MCWAPRRGRAKIPGAARAGGERRARRIPQSRARLRDARDAVAARLSRLAARRAERSQARHGNGARRSAGDDRARRQGAGSQDRDPRRHHHAAAAARAIRGCSRSRTVALVWATARGERRRRHERRARARRSRTRATNTGGCLYVAMTRAKERLVICRHARRATRFRTAAGINWSRTRSRRDCACASRPTTATARCCATAKTRPRTSQPQTSKKNTLPAATKPTFCPDWLTIERNL